MTTAISLHLLCCLLLLTLGGAAAAGAQFEPAPPEHFDASQTNMRPLLHVQALGFTFGIVGEPFESTLIVYRGGGTYLIRKGAGPDQVSTALAATPDLRALKRVLAEEKVATQRGDCGEAEPDYVLTRTLTFHGLRGRHHQIEVGGLYAFDCPAPIVRIFDAVCEYAVAVFDNFNAYCAVLSTD